ncbi:hypothetical protein [Micromonospora ureilytica]|uniref:hypothetical protein n=1 Tax=Micromonospora ureilytica TaxID=709868 RepID=UPI0040391C68
MTDQQKPLSAVALTFTWQSTVKGRLDTGTVTSTLELFDYGTAVTVERPTDVVMVKE